MYTSVTDKLNSSNEGCSYIADRDTFEIILDIHFESKFEQCPPN